jgi:MFS family permease
LIYSTVCLLHENQTFCSELDRNKSFRIIQELIQKESSQWSLYGTLSFAIVSCFFSPIFGSLSDTKNRKLPIVLTILNAILTGLIVTIGSLFQGTKTCLILYLLANIVNGFGGGSLILISYVYIFLFKLVFILISFSSCFGYATDIFNEREQHIQTIAIIEASLNIGVVFGYVLCTFIFELNARIWLILLIHVLLLILALLISLIFLKTQTIKETSTIPLWSKISRPFVDIRDLIRNLKSNSLLVSFSILLLSMGFYELFRMGSGSIFYLYLHRMSFNDTEYAAYFTCEQLGTSIVLILLALLRRKWRINEFYLSIIGLCLSLIGLILFAFANNHKAMIFGGK